MWSVGAKMKPAVWKLSLRIHWFCTSILYTSAQVLSVTIFMSKLNNPNYIALNLFYYCGTLIKWSVTTFTGRRSHVPCAGAFILNVDIYDRQCFPSCKCLFGVSKFQNAKYFHGHLHVVI